MGRTNYFTFAGKSCKDFGLTVEYFPDYQKPAQRVETVAVPGRSGLLRLPQGGYDNVKVQYQCWFRGGAAQASALANWLLASQGYLELRDTYTPGKFRLAAFDGPVDIANILGKFGRCTLSFSCLPQLWDDQGQRPVTITPTGSERTYSGRIYNPYPFPAKPLLTLTGVGAGSLTFTNGDAVSVFSVTGLDGSMTIDCETQNAYNGTTNLNGNLSRESWANFPQLLPGENHITVAGVSSQTITKLEVTPRFWHL